MRWKQKNQEVPDDYSNITSSLKRLYMKTLKPLEDQYKFHDFHMPPLVDADFESKPMVLLIGQYSTGKTSFIKYILERDFPGCQIGPEPTTDGFMAVMQGEKDPKSGCVNEGIIPGNALVVDKTKPFETLTHFGNAFLSRFQCSQMDHAVLKSISIIDTPGILAGAKQRVNRGYDFTKVLEWFAERVDRIILLFDAHKLDISDEFHNAIEAIKGHQSKIRIVLNKCDQINHQQLMRVYGALMWSLGKVITTPEVVRVYLGSYWDQPLRYDENRKLFQQESSDLFTDIQNLPKNGAMRKLNDLLKRARLAKVHAYIISHLKGEMPSLFGKDSAKERLIKNLPAIFEELATKHSISRGDFPDVKRMQAKLAVQDFTKFRTLSSSMIQKVDTLIAKDISELMVAIKIDEAKQNEQPNNEGTMVKGGIFKSWQTSNDMGVSGEADERKTANPFMGADWGEGVNAGTDSEWIVEQKKPEYDLIFESLRHQPNGKVSGMEVKKELVKSKLPNVALAKIWRLSDVDNDGSLDGDEFALAMHLVQLRLDGHSLPSQLPKHLIPPSHRG